MNKIKEFFEELETTKEYNGYFCSVADALNCQKETAKIVVKGKADYLLCVKDNQASLKKDIEDYLQEESLCKFLR